MISEEKKQILQMVQEGKISVDEAMKLLDALETPQAVSHASEAAWIRVRIEDRGKAKVNVNVPLGLAKALVKFVPKDALKEMQEQNIDLDAIIQAIMEGASGKLVDIVTDEGQKVEVFVE